VAQHYLNTRLILQPEHAPGSFPYRIWSISSFSNDHVVVESTGAFIDFNGNGIIDAEDVVAVDFTPMSGNVDLLNSAVTIHYNDLLDTPLNLSGFGDDDLIQIDVEAFIKNGHSGLALLGDPAAITLDQFTTYSTVSAPGSLLQVFGSSNSGEYYILGRMGTGTTPNPGFGVGQMNPDSLIFWSARNGGTSALSPPLPA